MGRIWNVVRRARERELLFCPWERTHRGAALASMLACLTEVGGEKQIKKPHDYVVADHRDGGGI
jgi:hypothetical protein